MDLVSSLSSSFAFVVVASAVTFLCCLLAAAVFAARSSKPKPSASSEPKKRCDCDCSCNGVVFCSDSALVPPANGSARVMHENGPVLAERQSGASMMEQLVPEITTHALSYLDYPSLCRLSMTNSLMRKAANDDNAWKALYHKDFTLEQDSVRPANGWKAYYASTRAIVNINAEFFNIIRERSLAAMGHFWLNADYVKCIHASGEFFTGYNAVMESWQIAFNWEQQAEFQVRDVRVRVLSDMAWVTMKTYVDMDAGPYNMTNVYEFHDGRWYVVHHHCSVMLVDGEAEQQMMHA